MRARRRVKRRRALPLWQGRLWLASVLRQKSLAPHEALERMEYSHRRNAAADLSHRKRILERRLACNNVT
jgi:hypothetical protein